MISIIHQQIFMPSFKVHHQLYQHWNILTEPKMNLSKIAELLRLAAQKPTIVFPIATPTPNLTHIFLPVKTQRVLVTPVSSTV